MPRIIYVGLLSFAGCVAQFDVLGFEARIMNSDIDRNDSVKSQDSRHRDPETSGLTVISSATHSSTPVSRRATSTPLGQPLESEISRDEPVKSPRPGHPDSESSRDDDVVPATSLPINTSFAPPRPSRSVEPPRPLNIYDVPKWPTNPSTLQEKTSIFSAIAIWAFEVLLTIFPIGTIVLCIVAQLYDGKSVDLYPWGQQIIQFTTIVHSSLRISDHRV